MRRITLVALVFLLIIGCGTKRGSGGTVSGKVEYKGQPVNGATLHFYPDSTEATEFSIPVGQDGTFRSSDIPPGDYKVVVQPSQAPAGGRAPAIPRGMDPAKAAELKEQYKKAYGSETPTIAFPKKYTSVLATDLKCKIQQGDQKLDLELKD